MKRGPLILVLGLMLALVILFLPRFSSESEITGAQRVAKEQGRAPVVPARQQPARLKRAGAHTAEQRALAADGYTVSGRLLDDLKFPRAHTEMLLVLYGESSRAAFGWDNSGYYKPSGIVKTTEVVSSDGSGSFTIKGLPRDLNADLIIDGDGLARTRVVGLNKLDEASALHLEVVVPDAASIRGNVNLDYWEQAVAVSVVGIQGHVYKQTSELDGSRYFFQQLPTGTYRVRLVFSPGSVLKKGERWYQDVALEAGALLEVNFGYDKLLQFSGRVLVDGLPPGAAGLFLKPKNARSLRDCSQTEVDNSGRFSFSDLLPGDYELVLLQGHHDNLRMWPLVQYHPGREGVQLVDRDLVGLYNFPRYGALTGTLVGLAEATLHLEGPLDTALRGAFRGKSDVDGSFTFDVLPPGRYDLFVKLEGSEDGTLGERQVLKRGIIIPAGGTDVDLGELALDREGGLELNLVGLDQLEGFRGQLFFWTEEYGEKAPYNAVVRRRLGGDTQQIITQLPKGTFRLGVVAWLEAKTVVIVPNPVILRAGELTPVRLEVVPTTVLTIKLRDYSKAWTAILITDENGRVRLPFNRVGQLANVDMGYGRPQLQYTAQLAIARNLKPGNYQVQIFGSEGAFKAVSVSLPFGETFLEIGF